MIFCFPPNPPPAPAVPAEELITGTIDCSLRIPFVLDQNGVVLEDCDELSMCAGDRLVSVNNKRGFLAMAVELINADCPVQCTLLERQPGDPTPLP